MGLWNEGPGQSSLQAVLETSRLSQCTCCHDQLIVDATCFSVLFVGATYVTGAKNKKKSV